MQGYILRTVFLWGSFQHYFVQNIFTNTKHSQTYETQVQLIFIVSRFLQGIFLAFFNSAL